MLKKYNYVPQIDMRDCGVAALSSIIQHYGSYYPLAQLRDLAQTNMEGTSALGIIKAAEYLNFDAQAIQADSSLLDMENIPFPFIVHVNKKQKFPHYYVVYEIIKDKITIGDPDPSIKVIKISKKKLLSEWTGTAIFIAPGKHYQIHKEKKYGLINLIPKLKKHTHIITKIILLSLFITSISILGSYYLQEILDAYIPNQSYFDLNIITFGLIISYIIQQLFFYLKTILLEKLSLQLISDLFLDYLKHIFELPVSFFSTRRTGEIISRFTDSTTIIDALASVILSIFLDISMIIFIGIAMILQNKILFLITLSTIPIYSLVILLFIPLFEKINNEVMYENSKLNSSLIEDINGIETIKSLSGEEIRFKHLGKIFSKYINKSLKMSQLETLQQALKQTIQLILNILVLWLGSKLVIAQELSSGQLITFTTLLAYFINPLENIINLQTKIQAAQVANNRLNEIYLVKSEHINTTNSSQSTISPGNITIQNLTYQYGFNEPTLNNISLTIQPGEKVCLVGTSGSGKTTLAKLLVRFFEPTYGKIFLSNLNLVDINKNILRQYINYLPQQPYLFHGSILDNLTLGNSHISTKKIIKACQDAEILSDIMNMPLQFHTELSDSSILSGGQKQRLSLARALLTESSVLILDEATSGLDTITEQRIIQNLLKLKNKTIIFIAHKLTIAEQSDRIFVLEKGCIIEKGNHKELIKKEGRYHQLYNIHT